MSSDARARLAGPALLLTSRRLPPPPPERPISTPTAKLGAGQGPEWAWQGWALASPPGFHSHLVESIISYNQMCPHHK